MKTISPLGKNGALYNVHCLSYRIAKSIVGTQGDVSRVDMSKPIPNDALFRFRCIPQYRSPAALELRRQVAELLRYQRQLAA